MKHGRKSIVPEVLEKGSSCYAHREQLSTYLRPMGSTVPAIYGPSADESM